MHIDHGPFVERWANATDSAWLTLLIKACHEPLIDDVMFPTLPPTEVQRAIQGNSEEIAVRGSFAFYRFIRDCLAGAGIPLNQSGRLLDFGTGWGRITRPFMRDIPTQNLYAVEPSAEWARIARQCNPYVSISQSEVAPPLPFRKKFFRYIVAYSIFSHLPEDLFDAWIDEFKRVLEPGGVVAFTFLGDRIVRELSKYERPLKKDSEIHFWHRILVEALEKHDPDYRKYHKNAFVFLPTHQTPSYGDSFISPALLRKKLAKDWDILVIDSSALAQDICIIQKRNAS